MTLTQPQKIAALVLAIYWPALFILAHIPIPEVIQQADVSDKSLHFLAYLILAFLLRFAVSGEQKMNWRKAAPWLVLFAIIVYAILDEWLQSYVAGRSSDMRDFFADMAGAFSALILCTFLGFWPAALLIATTVIFSITNVERFSSTFPYYVTHIPRVQRVAHPTAAAGSECRVSSICLCTFDDYVDSMHASFSGREGSPD